MVGRVVNNISAQSESTKDVKSVEQSPSSIAPSEQSEVASGAPAVAAGKSLEDLVSTAKTQGEQSEQDDIYVPSRPIITSMREFGIDSLISTIVNPIAVGLANKIKDEFWKKFAMMVGVPVFDKIMFFPMHVIKGVMNYVKDDSPDKKLAVHMKPELQKGLKNALIDFAFQDTVYASLLAIALERWPDVSPSILGFVSCAAGVLLAGPVETTVRGGLFRLKDYQLKKAGFVNEDYWEARFKIPVNHDYDTFLEKFSKEFDTSYRKTSICNDLYLKNDIMNYNARTPRIRLRTKADIMSKDGVLENSSPVNTLDIYFARAYKTKLTGEKNKHYPIWKEKYSYTIDDNLTELNFESLPYSRPKMIVRKHVDSGVAPKNLNYTRHSYVNHNLTLNMDDLNNGYPFHFLEITTTSGRDSRLLKEAMKFIVKECPIYPTDTTSELADIRGI